MPAIGDVQIAATGSQAAPLDYTMGDAVELIPKCVSAEFDGTGAGSSFEPTLTILAPNGDVVGSFPAASVAAGASAFVSWFPRVSAAAAAAAASGLAVAEIRQIPGSATTLTSTVLPQYTSLRNGVNAHFATTDPTVFNNSSTTLFTGSPLFGIGVLQPGTYRYDFNQFCPTTGTAGQKLTAYWSSSGTALLSELQQGRVQCTMPDVWDANQTNHLFWTEWQSFVNPGDVPGVAVPYGIKKGAANPVVYYELIVTQISPTPLSDL